MLDIFHSISKESNKSLVESMYYSLAEYREYIRKTVTNNGTPHRARDYIHTGLSEIAEWNGFTWEFRKVSFYEYIFLHHTSTNVMYVFVSKNSIAKLREELSERKKEHYLEGWAFINDSWSVESVRNQSGNIIMLFDNDDVSYASEKYGRLRDLNDELLKNYTAKLCVFITFSIER